MRGQHRRRKLPDRLIHRLKILPGKGLIQHVQGVVVQSSVVHSIVTADGSAYARYLRWN